MVICPDLFLSFCEFYLYVVCLNSRGTDFSIFLPAAIYLVTIALTIHSVYLPIVGQLFTQNLL